MNFTLPQVATIYALAYSQQISPIVAAERAYGTGAGAAFSALMTKAAVGASNSGDGLLGSQVVSAAFLEMVLPLTILGRIPGAQRAPFNTPLAYLVAASTFGFVAEGSGIPVAAADFAEMAYLQPLKIAGIAVVSNELLKTAAIAEAAIGAALTNGIVRPCGPCASNRCGYEAAGSGARSRRPQEDAQPSRAGRARP